MKPSRFLPDIGGIYCLVVFLALTAFAGGRALIDGDTLWHIKAGEVMLERGAILTSDIFSHTAAGHPWLAHEWLAEIIMAGLHQWAGIAAVTIFYFLLVAICYWLLFQLAEPYGNPWLAVTCISVAMVLSLTHLLARPHIFTWLFGALTLLLLSRGGHRLFWLPLIIALWANLHGGFVLGLALQGLFLAGRMIEEKGWDLFRPTELISFVGEERIPILVLLLSILATGLNPFGYKLLLFPFQVSAEIFSTSVGEWVGPNLQVQWGFRLFILLAIFLLFFRGPRITWTNRLFLLFFLNQAMLHARHISIAGIFLTPFLLEALAPYFEKLKDRLSAGGDRPQLTLSRTSGPVATILLALVFLLLGGTETPGWAAVTRNLFPLPEGYSSEAVRYLKAHPPKGKMFNQDDLGDYLIYALGPDYPVFIDGRLDMYGEKLLKDYMKIRKVSEDTDRLLRKYDIDWVFFPTNKPLVLYLSTTERWREVYRDDRVSILVRNVAGRP